MKRQYLKFFTSLILVVVCSICLSGCGKTNPYKEKSKHLVKPTDELSIEYSCHVLYDQNVEVTLKNNSNVPLDFDGQYVLEYKYKEEWYTVPFVEGYAFMGSGETILPGHDSIHTYDLQISNGQIVPGTYRIVQVLLVHESDDLYSEATRYRIACEFEI